MEDENKEIDIEHDESSWRKEGEIVWNKDSGREIEHPWEAQVLKILGLW